tara:strand:- start:979 stop:3021 length:2043 start_codon:yes stop_codon:yes gene_type:complete
MIKFLIFFLIFGTIKSELLHPESGSTLYQTHVRFEWIENPQANQYLLYVSNGNDLINDCVICGEIIDSKSLIFIAKSDLNWNTSYNWQIRYLDNMDNEIGASSINTFSIGPSISSVTTTNFETNSEKELTMFGSFFNYYSAVIDKNGNEIWNSGNEDIIFYNTDKYGRFFGSIFIGTNVENSYPGIKFDFEEGILWQEPGENFVHHDIFQLPNGNYIGLGTSYGQGPIPLGPWTPLFQGLGYEADGETIEFDWLGDKIIEWDAETKEEVWTWNVFDHFSMLDYDTVGGIWFEANQTDRFDWTHANAILFDEDDSAIYLSSRHLNRITKIAYPDGDVIWNLGYEMGSGQVDCGQDLGFSFQHSLQKLDNGNILTFDNGNLSEIFLDQDEKTSRSIEIDITEINNGCEASLAWEYVLSDSLYGYLSGNTQKLENGNYLSTTIGSGGTSLEVNPNGDEIWKANYNLDFPDGLVYRAMKIPGIFPIAYSVTFPQMNDTLYNIDLNYEELDINILNNGDYKQTFTIELDVVNNDNQGNYELELIITPIHHSEKSKIYNLSISNSNLIENNTTEITLMPNQNIFLSFGSNILENQNINNEHFQLSEPYPNPFNPIVNFDIEILYSQHINISIYDIYGKKVDEIFNGILSDGLHSFVWNADSHSTGMYIIECKTKTSLLTKKAYLIK